MKIWKFTEAFKINFEIKAETSKPVYLKNQYLQI
jgi:hypothetical protein